VKKLAVWDMKSHTVVGGVLARQGWNAGILGAFVTATTRLEATGPAFAIVRIHSPTTESTPSEHSFVASNPLMED